MRTVVPVARFSDMLLHPGAPYDFNGQRLTYPDIRLVYWCGGNPFHKIQDLNRLLQAWQRPETIIIHEPWWTPAARRADIVLPCTTTLERNDIGMARFDGVYFAMQQAIAPVGEARSEYDIYSALAARLGFQARFTEGRSEMDWLRHLYDSARQQATAQQVQLPDFEAFWEIGYAEFPPLAQPPVLFAAFRQDPERNPLKTPSGRIELFSQTIDSFGYDDCPGHAAWIEPAEWLVVSLLAADYSTGLRIAYHAPCHQQGRRARHAAASLLLSPGGAGPAVAGEPAACRLAPPRRRVPAEASRP